MAEPFLTKLSEPTCPNLLLFNADTLSDEPQLEETPKDVLFALPSPDLRDQFDELWHQPLRTLPLSEPLQREFNENRWSIQFGQKMQSVLAKLEWDGRFLAAEDVDRLIVVLTRKVFGSIAPEMEIVAYTSGEVPESYAPPDQIYAQHTVDKGEALKALIKYLRYLNETKGEGFSFSELDEDEEKILLYLWPSGKIFSRFKKNALILAVGATYTSDFLEWHKARPRIRETDLEGKAYKYIYSKPPKPAAGATGIVGMANLAQKLELKSVAVLYDAVCRGSKFTEYQKSNLNWSRLNISPARLLEISSVMTDQRGRPTKRFRGAEGQLLFADLYAGGNMLRAWQITIAVLMAPTYQLEITLGWRKPLFKKSDHHRFFRELKYRPQQFEGKAGVLRAAVIANETSLPVIYSIARRVLGRFHSRNYLWWPPVNAQIFELSQVSDWILGNGQQPIVAFRGARGLAIFARDYFAGNLMKAYKLVLRAITPEQWQLLDWPERKNLSVAEAFRDLPEGFQGHTLPLGFTETILLSETLQPKLTPAQRTVIRRALLFFISNSRMPTWQEWKSLGYELSVIFRDIGAPRGGIFPSRDRALFAIKREAHRFGLDIALVQLVTYSEEPPSDEMRMHWKAEGLRKYVNALLPKPVPAIEIKDWGDGPGQISVPPERFYGSTDFRAGRPFHKLRVFDSVENVLFAVHSVFGILKKPFRFLDQTFPKKTSGASLETLQEEVLNLLTIFVDRFHRLPHSAEYGTEEGKIGFTRGRLWLDGGSCFSTRDEALLAAKAFATERGRWFNLVLMQPQMAPSDALREMWIDEAVELYANWLEENDERLPSVKDWTFNEGSIGVVRNRFLGIEKYGVGKPRRDQRIFDDEEHAVRILKSRGIFSIPKKLSKSLRAQIRRRSRTSRPQR